MKPSILIHKPENLSISWAQGIVDQHDRDITVNSTHIISVDIGTTTRIKAAVEHDGPGSLPKRWFIKLPSLSWQARFITALPRLLPTEVRFYQEIAQSVPIVIPDCLAAQSQFGLGSTLVLSDVEAKGAALDKLSLSFEQASQVIVQLAHFHAHFWNNTLTKTKYHWLAGQVRGLEDYLGSALAFPLMRRGLQLAQQEIPVHMCKPALHYARHRRQAMQFLNQSPQTLVHHDCHPGNLFWLQDKPGFLDWQLIRVGEGISDVAYFLATALDPISRRAHEKLLIKIYQDTLANQGVTGFDSDSMIERYRAHLVYPFEAMVVTLAIGGMMKRDNNLELIRRAATAVNDWDAFTALPMHFNSVRKKHNIARPTSDCK